MSKRSVQQPEAKKVVRCAVYPERGEGGGVGGELGAGVGAAVSGLRCDQWPPAAGTWAHSFIKTYSVTLEVSK